MQKWRTTDSQIVLEDRWIRLRADTCLTPEGQTITPFYVLEYTPWLNCFVIDEHNQVLMVTHYRHGAHDFVLETVSGGMDKGDSSPMEGMRRELAEELGYVGGDLYQTGASYPNPSSQNNTLYSFIAVGGKCDLKQQLEVSETLQIQKLSFEDFIAHFNNPNVTHNALTLTTLFFATNFIKSSDIPALRSLQEHL